VLSAAPPDPATAHQRSTMGRRRRNKFREVTRNAENPTTLTVLASQAGSAQRRRCRGMHSTRWAACSMGIPTSMPRRSRSATDRLDPVDRVPTMGVGPWLRRCRLPSDGFVRVWSVLERQLSSECRHRRAQDHRDSGAKPAKYLVKRVELRGLEPLTPTLPGRGKRAEQAV